MTPADDAQLPDSRTAGIHRATDCAEGNEASDSDFHTRRLGETTAYEPRTVGKLRLLEQVGAGAFGSVWKARDAQLGRTVAVKLPHRNLISSAANRERFLRKARAAAQLRHPGIVPLYEVEEIDGLPAIVSAFIEGVSLRELLDVRRLEPREAAVLIADVADALDYAHSMKLVHRDVKPGNLMVEFAPGQGVNTRLDQVALSSSASGASHGSDAGSTVIRSGPTSQLAGPRVLVLDFGLALREEAEATMTTEGQILGTPAYMSPEQAAGHGHRVDRRSDVYSLGVILYELLAGSTPFRGSKVAILHQVLREEPRPPRSLQPDAPRDLEVICLKAMAKERGKRYSTARELADDLRRWLAGEPIHARPIGTIERLSRWAARNRGLATALATIAVMIVVGLISSVAAAVYFSHQEKLQRDLATKNLSLAEETRLRGEAERAQKTLRQNLYFSEMSRAGLAAESPSGMVRVRELVQKWQPEPPLEDLRGWEWRLLAAMTREAVHVEELPGNPCAVVVSPDGRLVAAAGAQAIVVWQIDGWKKRITLKGHSHITRGLCWRPDGGRLASAALNGTVKIWDLRSSDAIQTIQAGNEAGPMCWLPDDRLAWTDFGNHGDDLGGIRIWDLKANSLERRLEDVTPSSGALHVSPDGKRFAAVARGGAITVRETVGWSEVVSLPAQSSVVGALRFSPDGNLLASAGFDHDVRIWDLASAKETRTLRGHDKEVVGLAWSHDGGRLASAGWDFTARLWDAGTGQGLATFRGHLDSLNAIDVSDDHQLLFTCAGDDMLRVWDTSVPPVVRTIDTQRPGSASAAWHPNGDRFVTCHGSRWTIWDARSGHAGESGAGFGPCWSRDGSRFAVAENLTVVVTSGDKRIWKQTFDQPHAPRCLAWHPDNRRLLVGHSNGITIWTIDSGEVAPIPCGEHFDVVTVACHPDGHSAVGASTSGRFVICDTQKRAVTRRIQVDVRELVRSIRWSPDATQMATAGDSHTVVIWDVAAWKPLRSFRGHTFDLHGCSWSADGRRIASASRDGSVQVWDVATGNSALTFRQGDEMYAAEWSPDGERLLTVGGDGIVKLYDATVSPTEPEPTR